MNVDIINPCKLGATAPIFSSVSVLIGSNLLATYPIPMLPASSLSLAAMRWLLPMGAVLALSACNEAPDSALDQTAPPIVKTIATEIAVDPQLVLSGTIQAARQNPLSFQVGGRIDSRAVQSGEQVTQGQILFTLDTRDLAQALTSANAQVNAAESALQTAQDKLRRSQQLSQSGYISQQALDRDVLEEKEAQTRFDAAQSRAQQARNAQAYATLTAPDDGIVTETLAESGQVVMPGQTVAQFAHAGPVDIEVFLPQGVIPPASGIVTSDTRSWQASLREVAGSADLASRTIRARYSLLGQDFDLPLGSIAQLTITTSPSGENVVRVPMGALDERGQGPQVWIVVKGRAQPVPVQVLSLSTERAQIQSSLEPGTPVIAMGTHLLQPGVEVRVQAAGSAP